MSSSRPLAGGWDRAVAGDIGVHGSITLARTLLADLADRLELVVVPTLAGAGRRLFGDRAAPARLSLTKTASSTTGCVFLRYDRP